MKAQTQFFIPDESILRELGRLQVMHSQFDHTLRLMMMRTLGINMDDPKYWIETRGMTSALRERAREIINKKYSTNDNMSGLLNKILDDAEEITELRNRIVHSAWIKNPGEQPSLVDRDIATKSHRHFHCPSLGEIRSINERIQRVNRLLAEPILLSEN